MIKAQAETENKIASENKLKTMSSPRTAVTDDIWVVGGVVF